MKKRKRKRNKKNLNNPKSTPTEKEKQILNKWQKRKRGGREGGCGLSFEVEELWVCKWTEKV